ncbi:hypothetical protein [Oribacterium sp. FC2011]|uniref:hypothetical protein n=1 Tax=Oribacterium sp. FC2011 TaxID=1408311 RepID=UPI0004E21CC0|nr:hypothetical protein [Oribacterium sp. FC2011]
MYIPKEYYKAVMFVKKLRQDGKDLSEAVSTASKYYKVPGTELEKYIEDESSNETRFKYYTVQRLVATMDRPDFRPDGDPYVIKATSGIKVMERCTKENTSLELSKRKDGKKTCVYITRFIGLMSGYPEKSQAEANISKC